MHTDDTLELLEHATTDLGVEMRNFSDKICPAYETRELRRETEARQRRQRKDGRAPSNPSATSGNRRQKKFNMQTYKYHSLGDAADTIRRYGTTDSYSTEPVSDSNISRVSSFDHFWCARASWSIVILKHVLSGLIVGYMLSSLPKSSVGKLDFVKSKQKLQQ